jgi:flagellar FliL protein
MVVAGLAAGPAVAQDTRYVAIAPPVVVNLSAEERQHFMQVQAQMAVSPPQVASVEKHLPVLRHEMIMLLTGKPFATAQDIEARELWREELLQRLRGRMESLTGEPAIEALYFADLIVQ